LVKKSIKTKTSVKKASSKKAVVKKRVSSSEDALISAIIKGIEEKKGNEIVTLNLKNTGNSFVDYFVICHANNKIQAVAIVKSIEEQVYKITKETPKHIEGRQNAEWILIDYFNVVAHVFSSEKREFYNLENLWADAHHEKIAAYK
jgi:ribosome-associated protein